MKLKPIKNTFIFRFLDSINNKGQFNKNTTESGIMLQASFDDSAKESRWVEVTEVGPACEDVKARDTVLLPALRWTSGVKFNDETVWKSDESQAVAKIDKVDNYLLPMRDIVIFKKIEDEDRTTSFGLVLVSDPNNNTPRGVVINLGPDCVDTTVGDIVYYDDANFFDTFIHNGEELAFIKESSILALG